jgi:hypothetical protein
MSVILFSKSEVYQELANAYEGLKHLLRPYGEIEDAKFYKSLRRLYYANVATYLCQYHDDTPLLESELKSIDTFQEISGVVDTYSLDEVRLYRFVSAWNSLQYNLTTNDGEVYQAKESSEYLTSLVDQWTRRVLESLAGEE